jgi:hypothetical protein
MMWRASMSSRVPPLGSGVRMKRVVPVSKRCAGLEIALNMRRVDTAIGNHLLHCGQLRQHRESEPAAGHPFRNPLARDPRRKFAQPNGADALAEQPATHGIGEACRSGQTGPAPDSATCRAAPPASLRGTDQGQESFDAPIA